MEHDQHSEMDVEYPREVEIRGACLTDLCEDCLTRGMES